MNQSEELICYEQFDDFYYNKNDEKKKQAGKKDNPKSTDSNLTNFTNLPALDSQNQDPYQAH